MDMCKLYPMLFLFILAFFFACGKDKEVATPTTPISFIKDSCYTKDGGWVLPDFAIADGGVGRDGIPPLDHPEFIPVSQVDFIEDRELVIGIKIGNELRAYPHRIMDKHEVVNEEINGFSYTLSFCPLAGSALGFPAEFEGRKHTFGVSGFLFNANLIMYDRETQDDYSQMLLMGIKGDRSCEFLDNFPVVETNWENWKKMYPDSKVLSLNTGYNLSYHQLPISAVIKPHSTLFFQVDPFDDRLESFVRAHGIIHNKRAKIYPIDAFQNEITIFEEDIPNLLIVVGSKARNFMLSFFRKMEDGTILTFEPIENRGAVIMKDKEEGNLWNIFGEAVEGPRQGQKLSSPISYNAYWYAWGAIYPGAEIYNFVDDDG